MKKLLSLVLVAFMAMSMFVITASADDGFNPVDSGNFQVIGDWDFEEATIADNLTIPAQEDGGTVTYANGGVTIAEPEGGNLPGIQFLSSKVTSNPSASDYVYYEFEMDIRKVNVYGAFRLNLMNSVSGGRAAGYISLDNSKIAFFCVNSGGSGKQIDTVKYTPAADESRTKIGMLVNLSQKYYAGYINGEKVCEKTFDAETMRTGYMNGVAEFGSVNVAVKEGYAITIYDYKFYKGVAPEPQMPYSKIATWDLSKATISGGTEDTYTVSNEDGLKMTMTANAAMPEITIPGKSLSGTYGTDMYYYEFVVNSGKLSNESGYVIALWGKVGSTYKTFFAINVGKNTIAFKRGNNNGDTTYNIPEELVGTDIKVGLLIDQNDGSKGQTYVYINREFLWQTGNNDRTSYHPFNQKIVVSAAAPVYGSEANLLEATQAAGDEIVIKSIDVYHCAEGAEAITFPVIPEEGAFSATASYTATGDAVTATVKLTKEGNAGWYNKETVVIASYAADDSLLDFEIVDTKVKGGSTETVTKTVDAEVGGYVRAFLWDDMNTLVPTATFDVHNVQ